MFNCSFCNKVAEFEILIYILQEPKEHIGKWVGGEGWRESRYAQLFLCGKCLPFKKVDEVTMTKIVNIITIKDKSTH